MSLFGTTRSRVTAGHALLAPESFVTAPLPGWERTQGVVLISPRMGARFTQSLAFVTPESACGPAPSDTESFFYVLDGSVRVNRDVLHVGGYAYLPSDAERHIQADAPCRLLVLERLYVPRGPHPAPSVVVGQEQQVEGLPFMDDPDARLKMLLPDDPAFDMAVNVFTFQPGAALPQVEVHVMEHGLLMLAGSGIYRLGDAWYPVQEGDVIWMAPYCPQWFAALGKTPARYLYYKDVNRDAY